MIKVCWIALKYFDGYDGRTAFMILDTNAGKDNFDVILKDWELLK